MTEVLEIGLQKISEHDLMPLLGRYQMVPQLKRELLIDQAIVAVNCTSEEIQQSRQLFLQQQRIGSQEDLQTWMAHYEVDSTQLEAILTRQAQIEKFKHLTWEPRLEAHFLDRKAQFDQVVYSLLRVKDVGAAQEFYFRLQADEQPFTELARDYSEGPEAQTGGLVGPVELSTLHPTLAKMLASSPPGKLWPPARLAEWFVIVRLEEFVSAELNDAIRQRLLNDLFNEWVQEQLQKLNSDALNSTVSAVA